MHDCSSLNMLKLIVTEELSLAFSEIFVYLCTIQSEKIMEKSKMIGRKNEQSLISNYLASDKAELVAVYGRRRVGKTYLVKSTFDNQFDFSFTGMYNVTRAVHLSDRKSTRLNSSH